MKESLKKLPQEIRDLIRFAGDIAGRNNLRVYLVGGFVRDLILGRKNLDLDILVEGDGIKFAEDFARAANARVVRHRRFGTATVIVNDSLKIDLATVRKESYPEPGSLPLVAPGDLRDDLARRDFSINAMAISIVREDFGRLVDFFHGRTDIRNGKIRVLHDLSFVDDPTRILRAIRFEQRYDFRIEPHTLTLLKEAVLSRALNKVSPHRLKDEIILILKECRPIKCIRRLDKLTGFSFISPKLRLNQAKDSLLRSIDRQVLWFSKKTPRKRILDSWLVYLIGLMSNMEAKEVRALAHRFGFSRGETKRILSYKERVEKLAKKLKRRIPPSQVYKSLEPLSYEAILLLNAKYRHKTLSKNINDFFNIYNGVKTDVSGHYLARLGLRPGPDYKSILSKVLYAKLDGKISSRQEEQEFIDRLVRRRGSK